MYIPMPSCHGILQMSIILHLDHEGRWGGLVHIQREKFIRFEDSGKLGGGDFLFDLNQTHSGVADRLRALPLQGRSLGLKKRGKVAEASLQISDGGTREPCKSCQTIPQEQANQVVEPFHIAAIG